LTVGVKDSAILSLPQLTQNLVSDSPSMVKDNFESSQILTLPLTAQLGMYQLDD